MNTILVTGGAGFIGSWFVREWLEAEQGILVNLDRLTYAGSLLNLSAVQHDPRYRFVRRDVADQTLVRQLLRLHRPKAIVHLAAESHVDRSIDSPASFTTTNVLGTCTLLDEALVYWQSLPSDEQQAFRFLHVSTDEVFGSLEGDEIANEMSAYRPRSPYAASKAAADHFVRAYYHTYGLPTMVTHSSNNYGPYQYPEKLIPLAITNALAGRPIPVYGDGQQVRDWLHVSDHCRALRYVLTAGHPGETYNIAADCPSTNLDLVRLICRYVDENGPSLTPTSSLEFVPDRPGHDRRYALDSQKIRQQLGWSPRVVLDEGLRATVAWYVDHRDWLGNLSRGQMVQRRGLLVKTA